MQAPSCIGVWGCIDPLVEDSGPVGKFPDLRVMFTLYFVNSTVNIAFQGICELQITIISLKPRPLKFGNAQSNTANNFNEQPLACPKCNHKKPTADSIHQTLILRCSQCHSYSKKTFFF